MRINVRDILAEDLGYNRSFLIGDEMPDLESVKLTKPIQGEVTISKLEDSLLAEGRVQTEIELECHRCLRTFTHPVKVGFSQTYSEKPVDEDMPITDETVDLAPLVEQEILVNLPIKLICRTDCEGVEGVEGKYNKEEPGNRLGDKARIKKGS
jgi:uncharacterized protein